VFVACRSCLQVPLHYIGQLETLEHDLTLLFQHLSLSQVVTGGISVHYASTEDSYKSSLDTTLNDDDVRSLCEHLAQDYVCFGYALPAQCNM
jgi:hypothetical protein